jgi:hypothetical protein
VENAPREKICYEAGKITRNNFGIFNIVKSRMCSRLILKFRF